MISLKAAWPIDVIDITRDGIRQQRYARLDELTSVAEDPQPSDAKHASYFPREVGK